MAALEYQEITLFIHHSRAEITYFWNTEFSVLYSQITEYTQTAQVKQGHISGARPSFDHANTALWCQ